MKKRVICLILSAVLMLALVGCSAKSMSSPAVKDEANSWDSPAAAPMPTPMPPTEADEARGDGSFSYGDSQAGQPTAPATNSDKIIYTAYAEIETLEFEQTVKDVYAMMERYGSFLEKSSVTGSDYDSKYYGYNTYRSASFSIRVPKENYNSMTGSLSELGNITFSSTNADNITSQFYDTESRLKAFRTEESNLLDMMELAETVEDMITIQDRLSTVRYNIESLTTTLNSWQSQVDYSTVNLDVREVKRLTQENVIPKTFGQEVADGFLSSVRWLWQAIKDLAVFIVSAIPVLVIPAAIVVVIVVLSVRRRKKVLAKRAEQARAAIKQLNDDTQGN